MQKIKVLHVIKSLGRGGAEMLLPETLKIHNQKKYQFHYTYFLPWKNQLVENIESAGGKVTCLPANNNLLLLKQYNNLIEYVKEHNINLIHAHLPWAGFVSRFVYKKTGVPVIYTEHNMQERYHFITKYLNKYTYNWQSLVLGVSNDVVRSIQKNINPKIPVKVLLNGVNTKFFKREENEKRNIRQTFNIPDKAIVIGNVAVFRFQKRLKEWLQVLKQITEKHDSVYGLLVGSGPLEEEIKKELKLLNLENRVILPGLQSDIKPFFNAMDIFMMTSSFEGLPIALLEAMSMECAIVTTDAGGIKEVIRNDIDGMTVPVEQWQDLPYKLENLIIEPKLLKQMQIAARIRVIENFSLQKMVQNLEQVYQETINKTFLK